MASTFQQVNTDPGTTVLLYQPQSWALVSVNCDSGGPAVVGNSADLKGGTGQGVVLGAVPRYLLLAPGDTLYVYSDAIDRVGLAIHPLTIITEILAALRGTPLPAAPRVPPTTKTTKRVY